MTFDWDRALLKEVSKYPIIYSWKDPFYRSSTKRQTTWEIIAQNVLNSPSEAMTVRRRWLQMRESFSKILQKRRSSGGEKTSLFVYENEFQFLIPHIRTKIPKKTQLGVKKRKKPGPVPKTKEVTVSLTPVDVQDRISKRAQLRQRRFSRYLRRSLLKPIRDVNEPTSQLNKNSRLSKRSIKAEEIIEIPEDDTPPNDSTSMNPVNRSKSPEINTEKADISAIDMNNKALQQETEKFFLCLAKSVKRLHPLAAAKLKKDISNTVMDAEIEELQRCIFSSS